MSKTMRSLLDRLLTLSQGSSRLSQASVVWFLVVNCEQYVSQ
jgi:hypothetical protein